MTSPENPFDGTIWDPSNPEQAIEDPMHGAEARLALLSTPPYKNDDGTFYVFGGYYVCGTCNFDADGKPFIKLGRPLSMIAMDQDMRKHMEWTDKWRAGELPPYEELGYPAFDLEAPPYLTIG